MHFTFIYFIFRLYITVLVLPNIKMNPPQVYMCSPSWTLLPPPSPFHPVQLLLCWLLVTLGKLPFDFYYSEGIEEDACFSKLIVSDTVHHLLIYMSSCSLLTNIFKLCFTLWLVHTFLLNILIRTMPDKECWWLIPASAPFPALLSPQRVGGAGQEEVQGEAKGPFL